MCFLFVQSDLEPCFQLAKRQRVSAQVGCFAGSPIVSQLCPACDQHPSGLQAAAQLHHAEAGMLPLALLSLQEERWVAELEAAQEAQDKAEAEVQGDTSGERLVL